MGPLCTDLGSVAANCFAGSGRRWKTRMFLPVRRGPGGPRDGVGGRTARAPPRAPRRGSSSATEIEIRQGEEINRPSLLYAQVTGTAEQVERVEVGGSAQIVASGEYRNS